MQFHARYVGRNALLPPIKCIVYIRPHFNRIQIGLREPNMSQYKQNSTKQNAIRFKNGLG